MKMKKILTLLLAGTMLFSLSACSGGNTETESSTDSTQNIAGEIPESVTDSHEETPEAEPSETPEAETEDSRILVAYFLPRATLKAQRKNWRKGWGLIFMRLSRRFRTPLMT